MVQIVIGSSVKQVLLETSMINRHGLIAGATGTGKTITLQVLAEQFSQQGIPVFLADVKGDLTGLCEAGQSSKKLSQRLEHIGLQDTFNFKAAAVELWDIFGASGLPIRTTLSEIGPLLLSNLLELNETQSGIIYAAFEIADDQGLLLLDLPDLYALLNFMSENAGSLRAEYGNISASSLGAIRRRLLVLEKQGIAQFLGEPALALNDLMRCDNANNGIINLLNVSRLIQTSPKLYATVLLWLLSELFENLPEIGDRPLPALALFIDEAHLLFGNADKALLEQVEQAVRLIRSKGVGLFFVTQNPADIPEAIAAQLGLKIQHAMRAFTPKDRKAIKSLAQNFCENPELDTETVLTELEVGEALVSTLDDRGRPTPVERTLIAPPMSKMGAAKKETLVALAQTSTLKKKYEVTVDRESAHEVLAQRADQEVKTENIKKTKGRSRAKRSNRQSVGEAFAKTLSRTIASQIGRQIVRGLLGAIFKR